MRLFIWQQRLSKRHTLRIIKYISRINYCIKMYPRKMTPACRQSTRTSFPNTLRRERVRTILVKKYRSKFRTTRNPEFDQVLHREVDELLKTKNLNQTHLHAVEKKLEEFTKKANKTVCYEPIPQPNPPAMAEHKKEPSMLPPIKPVSESMGQDQWSRIVEHDFKKFLDEQRENALKEREKKRKVKEELFRQIQDKQVRSKLEKTQEVKFDDMLKKHVDTLEELEQKRTAERIEKIRKEKLLRDQQLREEYERKKKQRIEDRLKEQKHLEEIKKKMEVEVMESKKKREHQLQEAVKLIQENEKFKALQDVKRLKEREEDKKMLEEQIRAMEMQEKKRVDEMKAKEARIQALTKYAEEHVTKNEVMKRRQEEQRFLKEVIEREKREEQEEIRRKKAQRERELNARRYLDEQMSEKKKRKEEEMVKSKELVETWRKDEETFKKEQKEKAEELKKRNKQWYNEVLRQVTELKEGKKKGHLMNEREFMINKKLIEEIEGPLPTSKASDESVVQCLFH
eukprot:TRINITY_DN1595_c0_g1_i1.p2 TRINITY_DN1595_c0_g1~~TRINITY_DN1595_c0_g1_i1.p2  ORF type:complete len:513 (-),score=133.47 TRINITY_DN1595_c0_g1_i1:5666-7204(-)